MTKINSLLTSRLKQATEKFSKMTELAELSSGGNLSSFAGIFRVTPLSTGEKARLQALLEAYKNEEQLSSDDFSKLAEITSEIKAINNQAAILHGERIKKAQELLKNYRDGAFSAWLIAAYGNRQTPYNFLQYYELFHKLPPHLHQKLDEMPRQAVYTLASRSAPLERKEEIVKNYQGEPKQEILALIRKTFPLSEQDGRKEDVAEQVIALLKRAKGLLQDPSFRPSSSQKSAVTALVQEIRKRVSLPSSDK